MKLIRVKTKDATELRLTNQYENGKPTGKFEISSLKLPESLWKQAEKEFTNWKALGKYKLTRNKSLENITRPFVFSRHDPDIFVDFASWGQMSIDILHPHDKNFTMKRYMPFTGSSIKEGKKLIEKVLKENGY